MSQAVAFALLHKERTGEGQFVEVPMLETMVSFNLVRKMIYLVGIGQISHDRASELLSKPCSCGVFNPTPAVRILNDIHQGTYFASPR